jgi:hypothetical protein
MRSIRTSALAAGLLALTATAGRAQTGSIQATATVLSAITVTGATPLAFGNVTPGLAKTVAPATGGRFDLVGANSANVNLTFTLPANLTGPGSLPIGTWTGLYFGTNVPASATAFTPSAAATSTAFSGTGTLFVWVGATVTPGGAQPAGAYTGTVQLTAAYF